MKIVLGCMDFDLALKIEILLQTLIPLKRGKTMRDA